MFAANLGVGALFVRPADPTALQEQQHIRLWLRPIPQGGLDGHKTAPILVTDLPVSQVDEGQVAQPGFLGDLPLDRLIGTLAGFHRPGRNLQP